MAPATPAVATHRVVVAAAAGWLATAAGVLVLYLAVVVGGGALVGRSDPSRSALALLATILVALAAEPVRRRVQAAVARRLAGPVTEPYEILSGFAQRLGDTASVEQMTGRMARVLAEGTAASWTQVWLVVDGDLRLVASWPPGAATDPVPPPLAAQDGGAVHVVPVGHGDDVVGVLRVRERAGRGLSVVEARLLAGLAGQAGLLLARAQLQAGLRARVDDLSARARQLRTARAELVTAADVERRRLERNLHDGAQQELVALVINLRLARTLLPRDLDRARGVLAQQAEAAEAAIATLTALARGSAPPALVADGLPAALRELAATAPLPTTVRTTSRERYPPAVEDAVYYCASEAVQNAVKHSRGSCVEIGLTVDAGHLVLTVTDDGSGALPAGRSTGTGLRGMRERAAAVGGSVRIDATPGTGTTVALRVPAVAVDRVRR